MSDESAVEPILAIDGVDVSLTGASILRQIALQIGQGECVGLVGHNGAGKTTTLRVIMGLVAVQRGTLRFAGEDLNRYPAFRRASSGLGYAPEDRRLTGSMSVHENLCLPGMACNFDQAKTTARIQTIYDALPQLDEMRGRMASTLSGGQQKIVALGRAMMTGDKLLLLDEPFQGLAPALARDYGATLARLKERDSARAILVAESNPALLEHFVDRIYEIERGEIRAHERFTYESGNKRTTQKGGVHGGL